MTSPSTLGPIDVGSDICSPALEANGRPFRIVAMVRGHMLGMGAVARYTTIPALMRRNTLALMGELDRARGDTCIYLLANQRMRTE